MHDGKTSAIAKFKVKVHESDWNGDFHVSRKNFNELCTKLHPYLQKKQNLLRRQISVEVQVAY